MKSITVSLISIFFLANLCMIANAQDDVSTQDEAADLAKKTANPIANMISVPFQFNFNFGMGEYNRTQTVLNVMPVVPFRLNDKINVINRFILPVISQPDITQESGGTFGLGDINYSMFFTPARAGKIIWGIGPALNIPTRTNNALGSPEFGIGPTAVVLMMKGNWAYGFTANNVWSYESGNLSSLYSQVFITYTFPSAWFVNMMPTITANWKAPEGQQWSIPLGANLGKVVIVGKQPIKLIGGGAYYAVKPDNGPDWQLFAQAVFLFPKK